tara:strand:+ start:219 stop:383 length:165 start_codon:yes stop_codon:yes gene_type:complete
MNHPEEKSFIYETPEISETDQRLTLKPCNTNGLAFVGVSLVSCALMLAKRVDEI